MLKTFDKLGKKKNKLKSTYKLKNNNKKFNKIHKTLKMCKFIGVFLKLNRKIREMCREGKKEWGKNYRIKEDKKI